MCRSRRSRMGCVLVELVDSAGVPCAGGECFIASSDRSASAAGSVPSAAKEASFRPLGRDVLEPRRGPERVRGAVERGDALGHDDRFSRVTVDYRVGLDGPPPRALRPSAFIARRTSQFDASDARLGSWTPDAGSSDATVGTHEVTIPVDGGLPIDRRGRTCWSWRTRTTPARRPTRAGPPRSAPTRSAWSRTADSSTRAGSTAPRGRFRPPN